MMKELFGPTLIMGVIVFSTIGGVGFMIDWSEDNQFRAMSACLEAEMQWIGGDCVK